MLSKIHLFLVLIILMSRAVQAVELTPREQQAQNLLEKLNAGHLPALTEITQYFTGSCLALASNMDPAGSYYALIGLSKVGGEYRTTLTISYNSSDIPSENDYLKLSLATLNDRYVPEARQTTVDEHKVYVFISDSPPLYYYFSQDVADPNIYYLAASHIGPVYCQMTQIKN